MFKSKVKNSQRCYFAWENLRWGFCVVVIFSFVDVLHFIVVLLIAFRHHSSSFRGLSPGFLHPILYFQPSPSQSDSRHFHFQPFRYLLTASATVLSGHFLPTGVFYLTLLPDIFGTTCFYQGFPGSRKLFLEICRTSYWSSKQKPAPSVCLTYGNSQSFIHLKFVFIHVNIANVFTCVENFDKEYRSAATLFSSHENIK